MGTLFQDTRRGKLNRKAVPSISRCGYEVIRVLPSVTEKAGFSRTCNRAPPETGSTCTTFPQPLQTRRPGRRGFQVSPKQPDSCAP
jgi:hypothetical protein